MLRQVAFDYETQRWVEGPAAVVLLRAQLAETLACLEGPGGAAYLRFVRKAGDPVVTVAQAVADVRRRLEAL
jgi:hypothetical protein